MRLSLFQVNVRALTWPAKSSLTTSLNKLLSNFNFLNLGVPLRAPGSIVLIMLLSRYNSASPMLCWNVSSVTRDKKLWLKVSLLSF